MTHQYQNNYLLSRISGFFFDLMIIAGIASIDIKVMETLWLPFVLMAVVGAGLTFVYLRYVCKWLYPDYYYEGLLSMYGMMTGTISSGVLLLREVDPAVSNPGVHQYAGWFGLCDPAGRADATADRHRAHLHRDDVFNHRSAGGVFRADAPADEGQEEKILNRAKPFRDKARRSNGRVIRHGVRNKV